MSSFSFIAPDSSGTTEERLKVLGLTTEIIHNAYMPGLNRARNRTSLALPSSPAIDLYHDTNEQLRRILVPKRWQSVSWNHQPRLVHPARLLSLVISSATNVGVINDPHRIPLTSPKGPATKESVHQSGWRTEPIDFPDFEHEVLDQETLDEAPLWMLLHELTPSGLNMELSKPMGFRPDDRVDQWENRIIVPAIQLDGNFSIFVSNHEADEFDVPVDPR